MTCPPANKPDLPTLVGVAIEKTSKQLNLSFSFREAQILVFSC